MEAALETDKIDAHCAGLWADPVRMQRMAYTGPLFMNDVAVLARADDAHIPAGIVSETVFNKPGLSAPAIEGGILLTLMQSRFPNR